MSQNPQWNNFQPPTANADSAILDFNKPYSSYSNNNMFNTATSSSFPKSSKPFSPNAAPFTPSNQSPSYDIGNFSIGTFDPSNCYNSDQNVQNAGPVGESRAPETNGYNSSNSYTNGSSSPNSQGMRETGIIEKLLHSYGFIQCCERQARLFFHFSQFDGTIEHLHIGDPVEFEMTYDRRTGKPIASSVSKIAPEVVLSEERVSGTVTTEIAEGVVHGRISYENRGECFFLPYTKEDIEGSSDIHSGDDVTFQIATNQQTGTLASHNVRLNNPEVPARYQGVICSIKENFGFIERADVVKEIFFHFSEAKAESQLGDDVEFSIQTRNGKEVATNIVHLPVGTVVFEDLMPEILKGQVLKSLDRGNTRFQADPLPGRIRYRGQDRSEIEIQFGVRDQLGEFTLKHGDWVKFNVAIDRRDQLQRATNIQLLEESFVASGEKREQGTVMSIKDNYGFIKCAERETNIFFHLNEILDLDSGIKINDEVEFTVTQDASVSTRYSALRIRVLDPGTVSYETGMQDEVEGIIIREPATQWAIRSPVKGAPNNGSGDKLPEAGIISYQLNGIKETKPFYHKDCNLRNSPKIGDKVRFNIRLVRRNKEVIAMDIEVIERNTSVDSPEKVSHKSEPGEVNERGPPSIHQGYVAALKDGFGFIETLTHDREIFFHYSHFNGDAANLLLGQEVQYMVSGKTISSGGKVSAENVELLPNGSLPELNLKEEIYEGMVTRPLRSVNPDQPYYAGLIQMAGEGKNGQYEFGITSLYIKKDFLQKGDQVTFQVDALGTKYAGNVRAMRKKHQATVEAIKGQFGFLSYELEDGKKLFFHMTEVRDGAILKEGDQVEFYVFTNQRTNKSSACQVTRLSGGQRPERLISRIRSISLDESRPRMIILRQPRGPDGTRGFKSTCRKISTMSAP